MGSAGGILGLLGAGGVWCWWRIRLLGDARLHLPAFYGWFAAAFGGYLAMLWLVARWERRGLPRRAGWIGLAVVGIAAIASRLLLLGAIPTLSDDIYRYRWDGRVQAAGLDPYAFPPDHPRLAGLRDAQFSRIKFPHLRTVYPPLTQAAFRLGEAWGGSFPAHKRVMLLAEALAAASVLWLLWQRGRSLVWVAAYAWHPLVILEIAGSGHNDALGIALLWLGVAAWEARRRAGAAAAWAAACWAKFASLLLLPWLWRQGWPRRRIAAWLALCALAFVLQPSAVSALVASFTAMAARVESNASVAWLLTWLLSPAVARTVGVAAGAAWAWWCAGRYRDPVRYLLAVIAAALVLAPALHPWYVVWLIPCFCFRRPVALLALSGLVVLGYTVWPGYLASGAWQLPAWARALEYAPVAGLAAWPLLRRAGKKETPPFLSPSLSLKVGVIIPARNEAEGLRRVLAELPREQALEVIVVDNGSTDATAEVAADGRARVVRASHPGYGRACLAGIAALSPEIDTVAFLDADHSDYPEDLAQVLAPIARGDADLVIGSRRALAQPGSLTPQQRAGNALACALLRLAFGARHTDLGPFRAIRRAALDRLRMRDLAYGWTVEMQAKAARARLRVAEVPVRYRPRIGRSKISGTVKGTLLAGAMILSTIAREALEEAGCPERRLLIFLKQPVPGQVKTRLASSVGSEEACRIYREYVELLLTALRPLRSVADLYVDPPSALADVQAWVGPGWTLRPQEGRTLGERLRYATTEAFAEGAEQAVVIGTDSPWLRAVDVEAAFDALRCADAVAGPTEDGGYYLIGLAQPAPGLFDGIAWSTPSVYDQTLQRAARLGLRVAELGRGYDVDRAEDHERFIAERRAACLS